MSRTRRAAFVGVLATVVSLMGATAAAAAPGSAVAPAATCDGFKIASASKVVNRSNSNIEYGAVQVLRNYCHVPGDDDYIVWIGRGFLYNDLPGSNYLNVQLQRRNPVLAPKPCTQYDKGWCQTGQWATDITSNSDFRTIGTVWYSPGPPQGTWYGHGETDWK